MEKLCDERHDIVNRRLNNHSERIDALEQSRTRDDERIKHILDALEKTNSLLRWALALAFTTLLGIVVQGMTGVLF